MPFPRSVLEPGERLLVHVRPHWRQLVRPAVVVCVSSALAGAAAGFLEAQIAPPEATAVPDVENSDLLIAWGVVAVIWAGIVLAYVLPPVLRWRRTAFVLTSHRVLYRAGGLRRGGADVPLDRISAVRYRHTLTERAFGTGSLLLERGYLPPVEIDDVPRIAAVHAAVYDELTFPTSPDPGERSAVGPRGRMHR